MKSLSGEFEISDSEAPDPVFAAGESGAVIVFAIPGGDQSVEACGESGLGGFTVKAAHEFSRAIKYADTESAFQGRRQKRNAD
jgi:hypothetical protein